MPLLKMNRVRHSVSVAEFMYSHAESYGLPSETVDWLKNNNIV